MTQARKDALQHPMTDHDRAALAGALTAIVKRNALAHDNAARAHRRRWFKHAADESMGVKK